MFKSRKEAINQKIRLMFNPVVRNCSTLRLDLDVSTIGRCEIFLIYVLIKRFMYQASSIKLKSRGYLKVARDGRID